MKIKNEKPGFAGLFSSAVYESSSGQERQNIKNHIFYDENLPKKYIILMNTLRFSKNYYTFDADKLVYIESKIILFLKVS